MHFSGVVPRFVVGTLGRGVDVAYIYPSMGMNFNNSDICTRPVSIRPRFRTIAGWI